MKASSLCALTAAVLLSGCSTVIISSPGTLSGVDVKGADGKADRVIMVANEGYYLFQWLPLVAGDVTWDKKNNDISGGIKLFSHQLRGDRMLNAISRYAERENCDLVDIVVNNKNVCDVNFFSLSDLFHTIVGYQAITYSGVLRAKGEPEAKGL